MREVTVGAHGGAYHSEPQPLGFRIYDTSGPYTDSDHQPSIER